MPPRLAPGRGWFSLLSEAGKRWSIKVLQQMEAPDVPQRLATLNVPDRVDSPRSRQAQHARLERMRSTVTAGTLILAAHDEQFADFLLSHDFALLRPLCAATHLKFPHLLQHLAPLEERGCRRLFERSFAWLMSLPEVRQLDDERLLSIPGAVAGMFVGPLLFAGAFREQWAAAFTRATQAGLTANPYLRMQLSIMGSYVGDWRAHVEWLLDPGGRELEIGDMYLFVRRDFQPETLSIQLRHLRGIAVPPWECLSSRRPCSTLNLVVDYICGCLRDTAHLENPALTMMLLNGIDGVRREVLQPRPELSSDRERSGVIARLAKLERIQVMEKRRFWSMLEGLSCEDTRARLVELWQRARALD